MARPGTFFDTLPPEAISDELAPVIQELGLTENCRQLAMEGWTVVENAASPEFNSQLRDQILLDANNGGANMLLAGDLIYAQAVLNPKLMALAEFSVGRGCLISQVAASVRKKGEPMLGLHADHNWLPAPFPEHNMLLTACWACDEYTKGNGATQVIPGSANLRRHPSASEVEAMAGAIPIECAPGSVAIWDGNIWHASGERSTDGERVVCHITYTRLMMRQVEDYRDHEQRLIQAYGAPMASLLGHNDGLFSADGFDYSKIVETFNNAKR